MHFKNILLFPLIFISCLALARPDNIYDPSRDALSDFNHARTLASSEHKNIFVIAGGNWCSYCYKFEQALKESSLDVVIKQNFIPMKANFGDGNDNEAFFSLFPKVSRYPHIMIISAEGKLLESTAVPSTEQAFKQLLTKYSINTSALK